MTVVVGFVGTHAAIMASDSEATEADHTRFDASKIWHCHGLLLGYSGNTAIEVPLAAAFEEALPKRTGSDRSSCVKCLEDAAKPVLERVYSNYVPRPPEGTIPVELQGHLLVVGHDTSGYWIGHLNESNIFTYCSRPFHAIGAGSVAAQVATGLLSRYAAAGRPLSDVRLIAHRTVTAVIAVLGRGYGVGGQVRMWESHNGQPFCELPTDEMDRVAYAVEEWIGIEKDSLSLVTGAITEGITETATGLLIATSLPADLEPPPSGTAAP